MMLDYLFKGLPGHPLHPPLTDLTIGTYSFATIGAIFDVAGPVVGFVLLTAGGWLGGTVVFVHGMRVLSLVEERFTRAAAPAPPEQAPDPE
jgi:uncharacterized membrane protein